MKLAFVADVHIGNHKTFGGPLVGGVNLRAQRTLDAFNRALHLAEMTKVHTLVVAGDLFDVARPAPALLARAMRTMRGRIVEILLASGNHDQDSAFEDDNALAPIDVSTAGAAVAAPDGAVWTFRDKGRDDVAFDENVLLLVMPYVQGDVLAAVRARVDAMTTDEKRMKRRVLVMHVGVRDESTPPWLRDATDAVHVDELAALMVELDFELAAVGNWHNRRVWTRDNRVIVQCGALVPTGFDNPGNTDVGLMHVYDTDTRELWPARVDGPRFFKLVFAPGMDLADVDRATGGLVMREGSPGDHVYIDFVHDGSAEALELARLIPTMVKRCGSVTVRSRVDTTAASAAAAAVARTTATAETVTEAVARYAADVRLPPGVDRKRVVELALQYIARGGER